MKIISPLTGSDKINELEVIAAEDVIAVWKGALDLDVSGEFQGVRELRFCECQESGLRFFSPMVTGSEGFYEKLQKYEWYYLEEKREYDIAAPYIGADDSVLEVGCGRGAFAGKIRPRAYLGLEFSEVAKGMATAIGLEVRTETIESHADENVGKYDVVCSFQVLEHVADIRSFIAACVRCLRPGGLLIYSVPCADSYLSLQANAILNMPPHHVSHWPESAFHYVAGNFGLTVEAIKFEVLSDLHVRSYANLLCTTALNSLLKRKQSLVDRSMSMAVVTRLSRLMGGLMAKGLQDARMRPRGHSVTAIYRKS